MEGTSESATHGRLNSNSQMETGYSKWLACNHMNDSTNAQCLTIFKCSCRVFVLIVTFTALFHT